jgi:hypothetical protein
VRIEQGFAFVRPWREVRAIMPTADFGGLLVYRAEQIPKNDGRFWIVRVTDWKQAAAEPTLIRIRNLQGRLSVGD